MNKLSYLIVLLIACLTVGCSRKSASPTSEADSTFHYAKHIAMERHDGYTVVNLSDPWKKGKILHSYIVVERKDSARMTGHLPKGTVVYTPLSHAVVFTTAHANLAVMLQAGTAIAGVADAQYMHIPFVQQRLGQKGGIVDVGNSMKPDIEKIISLHADAMFLSPFENSGGYGKLEEINIPIIECADYMETGALGRAEWMKFYGMLFGREAQADSLFNVVENNYQTLVAKAKEAKKTLSVLPDRKTGAVWYVPGGQSSMGLLYHDAGGKYAYSTDKNTGSLALPFETVLDKMGQADFWILSYNGDMTLRQLAGEYQGYSALKPMKDGEVYGCPVDKVPYFEEVSWRPDWLLGDLIQLFHPDLRKGKLRYYHKLG